MGDTDERRTGDRRAASTWRGSSMATTAAAPRSISRNRTITYDELAEQSSRLRGGLAGLGVGDGDRVAVICGNGHPFVIAYLAIVGLGAVVVPLNPTSPAPELQRELAAVDAVAVDRRPQRGGHVAWRRPAGSWARSSTSSRSTATPSTGRVALRRPADERAAARRRRRPRPPGRADVHQRHGRLAAGGDAHPRQPAGEHRPGALGARPGERHATSSTGSSRRTTSSGSTWSSG